MAVSRANLAGDVWAGKLDRMEPAPSGYSFPIARRVLRFASRARANWLLRHQHPFNFWIHMAGIPLALLVAPVLLVVVGWAWAVGAFVLGYFLQWVGHKVEGNDVGEFVVVKRLLGLKAVSIAPRYLSSSPAPAESPARVSAPIPPA